MFAPVFCYLMNQSAVYGEERRGMKRLPSSFACFVELSIIHESPKPFHDLFFHLRTPLLDFSLHREILQ